MRPLFKSIGACALVVLIGLGAARATDRGGRTHASVAAKPRAAKIAAAATPAAPATPVGPVATKATAADPPATAPADPVGALPACIPVADFAGDTVGCALKSQLYPATESATTRRPPNGMPGFPVFDHEGGAIVGYEVTSLGYVTASTASDASALAKLTDCMTQLNDGSLAGSPALAGCTAPLEQFGIADPATEAHERAASLAPATNSTP